MVNYVEGYLVEASSVFPIVLTTLETVISDCKNLICGKGRREVVIPISQMSNGRLRGWNPLAQGQLSGNLN